MLIEEVVSYGWAVDYCYEEVVSHGQVISVT